MKTFLCVIGFVMIALVSTANAQDRKPLETLKEWRGDNPNEGLAKDSPKFITNAKDLEKLWKAWDIKEKLPEIDFAKEILLVETTRGSRLNLKATPMETISSPWAPRVLSMVMKPKEESLL